MLYVHVDREFTSTPVFSWIKVKTGGIRQLYGENALKFKSCLDVLVY